jgi:hypothetical protein
MRLAPQCLNYFIIAYAVKAVVAVAGLGLVFRRLVRRCLKRCFLYLDLEDGEMVVNGSIGVAPANAFRFGRSRQLI